MSWPRLTRSFTRTQKRLKAFFKCIEIQNTGPFASRARYQLAEEAINQKKFDDAEKILKQNLELMGLNPDPEAHERSLLALAGLLYQNNQYREASIHLQQALDRYPGNPRATMARHVLADCYRRLAEKEKENFRISDHSTQDAQQHFQEETKRWYGLAQANYQKLKEDLLARQAKSPLPEGDAAILRDAELSELDCRYNLGQYKDTIRLAEIVVARYPNRAESLVAYRQILHCYFTLGQFEPNKEKQEELAVKARDKLTMARRTAEEAGRQGLRQGNRSRNP